MDDFQLYGQFSFNFNSKIKRSWSVNTVRELKDIPQYQKTYRLHRGSYMSAHVLLNLLNELGKRYKMRGLPSILSLFLNEF